MYCVAMHGYPPKMLKKMSIPKMSKFFFEKGHERRRSMKRYCSELWRFACRVKSVNLKLNGLLIESNDTMERRSFFFSQNIRSLLIIILVWLYGLSKYFWPFLSVILLCVCSDVRRISIRGGLWGCVLYMPHWMIVQWFIMISFLDSRCSLSFWFF